MAGWPCPPRRRRRPTARRPRPGGHGARAKAQGAASADHLPSDFVSCPRAPVAVDVTNAPKRKKEETTDAGGFDEQPRCSRRLVGSLVRNGNSVVLRMCTRTRRPPSVSQAQACLWLGVGFRLPESRMSRIA
ncbi:hypothetical protein RJ55_03897 [Drechmeria coniospora]|nr:hypothetical protein RJ55_03897 [Drechmeria coniospora]